MHWNLVNWNHIFINKTESIWKNFIKYFQNASFYLTKLGSKERLKIMWRLSQKSNTFQFLTKKEKPEDIMKFSHIFSIFKTKLIEQMQSGSIWLEKLTLFLYSRKVFRIKSSFHSRGEKVCIIRMLHNFSLCMNFSKASRN